MSAFVFGDFHSDFFTIETIRELKSIFEKEEAYIWFDEEINFYDDIETMLNENRNGDNNIKFSITTKFQPTNSSDLLFPFDKYDMEELFPNGFDEDRDGFNKICRENLEIFNNLFLKFVKTIQPKKLRIFIVIGYDNSFEIRKYSSQQMFKDVYEQVKMSSFLSSVIYEISD